MADYKRVIQSWQRWMTSYVAYQNATNWRGLEKEGAKKLYVPTFEPVQSEMVNKGNLNAQNHILKALIV